jgi:hypothetical protein
LILINTPQKLMKLIADTRVRFGSKADVTAQISDVRFAPESKHASRQINFGYAPRTDISLKTEREHDGNLRGAQEGRSRRLLRGGSRRSRRCSQTSLPRSDVAGQAST